VGYCRQVFKDQIPFDYQLSEDDGALYCIEMTVKAFQSAGIELCKPIRLGDMERAPEFPLQMWGLRFASRYALERPLTFEQYVYFPGNDRHGIWSAKQLMTVVPATFAPGHPDYVWSTPNGPSPGNGRTPSAKKVSAPASSKEGTAAQVQRVGT
jgi:hypothetical protein